MRVAVLGFGTVGKSVYEMLGRAQGLEQGPVLARPGKADAPFKTDAMETILADPSIEAVAEALTGVDAAYAYARAALQAGKHVVTANKALVAAHGPELDALARARDRAFLFGAACGGGVPFLQNLVLASASDRIFALGGILNGTTNYILDAMQRKNMDYSAALLAAQGLGFAEADPTADVSGLDSMRKLMLACAAAYGELPREGLHWEGVQALTAEDAACFRREGWVCRLLARGGRNADHSLYAYVEPVLLPETGPECAALENQNLVRYEAEYAGPVVLMGQGAGGRPTASAMLRDLSNILQGARHMLPPACRAGQADNGGCTHSYYVRLPQAAAQEIVLESMECDQGVCRGVTRPLSVRQMHETAARLRAAGHAVFFAAMG